MPNKKTEKQLIQEGKSQEYIDKYFGRGKTGRPEEWTEEKLTKLGNGLIKYLEHEGGRFFNRYLIKNGFNPDNIERYCDKYESFCQLIKKARLIQEEIIASIGLEPSDKPSSETSCLSFKRQNTAFAMFWLKCHRGWIEEEKRKQIEIKKQDLELKRQQANLDNDDDWVNRAFDVSVGDPDDERSE